MMAHFDEDTALLERLEANALDNTLPSHIRRKALLELKDFLGTGEPLDCFVIWPADPAGEPFILAGINIDQELAALDD